MVLNEIVPRSAKTEEIRRLRRSATVCAFLPFKLTFLEGSLATLPLSCSLSASGCDLSFMVSKVIRLLVQRRCSRVQFFLKNNPVVNLSGQLQNTNISKMQAAVAQMLQKVISLQKAKLKSFFLLVFVGQLNCSIIVRQEFQVKTLESTGRVQLMIHSDLSALKTNLYSNLLLWSLSVCI